MRTARRLRVPRPGPRLRAVARRAALALLPAFLAVAVVLPGTRAAETTSLAGAVAGVEICPQVWCGAAIFIGRFQGDLEGASGEGTWWVAVNHDDLPRRGETAPLTGGEWAIVIGERRLAGTVSGGTILNNGRGTFTVQPVLELLEGGEGALTLTVLLDHGVFPPTVGGKVAPGRAPRPTPTPAPTVPTAPAVP